MQTPEELRANARRLIALSKRAADPRRAERFAGRAFELAQLAEQLTREPSGTIGACRRPPGPARSDAPT